MRKLKVCIKHGTTRTVLLTKQYAFKFPTTKSWPMFLCGLLANIQERKFSKMKGLPLCPVIFYLWGGFFSVMPRVQVKSKFDPDCYTFLQMFNKKVALMPEVDKRVIYGIVEQKIDSVGMLNGEIVAVDYGS